MLIMVSRLHGGVGLINVGKQIGCASGDAMDSTWKSIAEQVNYLVRNRLFWFFVKSVGGSHDRNVHLLHHLPKHQTKHPTRHPVS